MRRKSGSMLIASLLWPLTCLAQSGEPITELRIGILHELTGPAAELGAACDRGFQTAWKSFAPSASIGGVPVKLILGDIHDDAKTAVSEYQRMRQNEGIQLVIHLRSKSAMPVNPLSEKDGVVSIGIVGHPQFLTSNKLALRVYPSADQEGAALAAILSKLNKNRIAMVTVQDEYAVNLARSFRKAAEALNATIVLDETLLPTETDFAPTILRISSVKPDSVFIHVLLNSGTFIRKLAERGVQAQLASFYWIQQKEQIESAGVRALDGLVFVEVDANKPKFKERYSLLFPEAPFSTVAYLCYSALGTVLKGLDDPQSLKNRQSLQQTLLNLNSVDLLDGPLVFKNREVKFEMSGRQMKDGRPEPLELH